jgi:peptidyl-tRNA hydrolase, PTH1 family
LATQLYPVQIPMLIAGLGNPGREYLPTRHNFGFIFLDYLARKYNIPVKHKGFSSLYGKGLMDEHPVILLKPQTFMNLSGLAVNKVLRYYNIPITRLVVVCDDFNLKFGAFRLRKQGSAGGQKGLQSIIQTLHTEAFARLRLGIGPVPEGADNSDFVLQGFRADEHQELESICGLSEHKLLEFLRDESQDRETKGQG